MNTHQVDNKSIFTIDNFLNHNECNKYIKYINELKLNRPNNFTNDNRFFNNKIINKELSKVFYDKLKIHFENNILNSNNQSWNLLFTSDYIFMAHYGKNKQFDLHTDTGCYYNYFDKSLSKFTMLIYLNDNYTNGYTSFYNDNFELQIGIEPKQSRALIFDIDLWHKGNEVLDGEKYWIGCELICKRT